MRYEEAKIALAIKHSEDLEQVKSLGLRLVCLLTEHCKTVGLPDNYDVYSIHEGKANLEVSGRTKEFCLGYIEGDNDHRLCSPVICINTTIVWPGEQFGDLLPGEA